MSYIDKLHSCIKDLTLILNNIRNDLEKKDLSMFRRGGASGSDAYQGSPSFYRIYDKIINDHCEVIDSAFKQTHYDSSDIEKSMILLPLDVGDTVFLIASRRSVPEIYECRITSIHISKNKDGILTKKYRANQWNGTKTIGRSFHFSFDEIGNTAFVIPDQAVLALEKRKEEQNG